MRCDLFSDVWWYMIEAKTVCGGMSRGCQLSYRWPGKLPWLASLSLSLSLCLSVSRSLSLSDHTTLTHDWQAIHANHTAVMAYCPSPFGIPASKIPNEHCPPLWLDKGSGVIGWLIAPCRLWFFSLIAGWVGDVWCWHALKMFCTSLTECRLCLYMLPVHKKIFLWSWRWAEEGPADFEVAQKIQKWSHQSGIRLPFWPLCEHWHFNL